MVYYVYLSGGGGCDYTIDCNKKLVKTDAKNMEEARVAAAYWVEYHGEFVEDATILEVNVVEEFDMAGHQRKKAEEEQAIEEAKRKEKDRQEYERLKIQFES